MFDYMSPDKIIPPKPKKRTGRTSKIKRVRYKSSSPKKSPAKSARGSAKKSPPKSASKPRSRTARRTSRDTTRRSSYKRRSSAKKHGVMREYLKGKNFKGLSPIMESPLTPESRRDRRNALIFNNLPKTPKKMRKSSREQFWENVSGNRF